MPYLADHPRSGRALFTKKNDAVGWMNYQNEYHYPDLDLAKWVTVGSEGTSVPRLPTGKPGRDKDGNLAGGEICHLVLDERAPRHDEDHL